MALDLEQLHYLTDEQRGRYLRQEKTFESDGWNDVVEWLQQNAEFQGTKMLSAKDWNEFLVARGARAAFMALLQLRDQSEAEYAQMAADRAEHDIIEDELEHE